MRVAVRGRFESSILIRLMANLPLPAPFTEHVRFSLERAHWHLSSYLQTSECHSVPLCAPTCVFRIPHNVHVSQGRTPCTAVTWFGAHTERRPGLTVMSAEVKPVFLTPSAFNLNPETSPPLTDGERFSKPSHVLSCLHCHQVSVNSHL